MKQFFIKHKQDIVFVLAIVGMVAVAVGILLALFLSGGSSVKGERYQPTGQYALLDLGSTGCAPCKQLQPVFESLEKEYGEKIDIKFFDITNTSEGAKLGNYYRVSLMPTLLFLDGNGNEVKRVTGFHTQEQIEQIFYELRWLQ